MIQLEDGNFTGHFAFSIVFGIHKDAWHMDSEASVKKSHDSNLMQYVIPLKVLQRIFLPNGVIQWVYYTGVDSKNYSYTCDVCSIFFTQFVVRCKVV